MRARATPRRPTPGRLAAAAFAVVALGAALAASAGSFATGRLLLALGAPRLASLALEDPAWKGAALLLAGDPAGAAAALRRTRSPEAAYNLGNALAGAGDLDGAIKAYDLALLRDPKDGDAKANRAAVAALHAERATAAGGNETGGGLANSGVRMSHDPGRDDTTAPEDTGSQSRLGDGMVGNREAGSTTDTAGGSKVSRQGTGRQSQTQSGEGEARGSATDAAGQAGKGAGRTEAAEGGDPAARKTGAEVDETRQATLQWLAAIPDDPGRFLKLRIAVERDRRVADGTAVQPGGDGW